MPLPPFLIHYADHERLTDVEYIDFLRRTDLGSQYPKKGFAERIPVLLQNVDICITARDEAGLLVGICFGITDGVYFLFLTDLGVDRDYTGQGIGRELVRLALEKAGGPADITVTTIANSKAVPFYRAIGMNPDPDLVVRYCDDWEDFVVE